MARYGFIHDKLEIKFLVLYAMARVAAPIDFPTLTGLTMIDDGVDYFEFAEAVPELVQTGNLSLTDGKYAITEEGRKNGAVCEGSLPYSVRAKCSEKLARLNAALRRDAQVRARVAPREDGAFTLCLAMDDEAGSVLSLELCCPSREQADHLAGAFRERPEHIYNGILELLLAESEKEGAPE